MPTSTAPPDRRWLEYFFGRHDQSTLRAWARGLQLFRYCRAAGGHANDADRLECAIAYSSEPELESIFASLGVRLQRFDELPPQPIPGHTYPLSEYDTFVPLVPGTRWLAQPRRIVLAGASVFGWATEERITLALGEGLDVTEADVAAAGAIETLLLRGRLDFIEPPLDNRHCLCPRYWPEFFE